MRGRIYHLGSPFCDAPAYNGPFFAYELLSERSREALPARVLEFAPEFVPALSQLVSALLAASPARMLVFTTDWQACPEPARREAGLSEQAFWQRHASQNLLLNALYSIHPNT
jgi:hypothetical protein